jgi:Ricin-type beta-trefoil lectin domain
MRSRSVMAAFLSAVAIVGGCLAGGVGPVASAAAAVSAAAVSPAASLAKAPPATSVQLPALVSQRAAAYTPDVYAGGNCSTYCNPSTVRSIAVVNGEAIVAGAFGQVCTPAPGATYAACPAKVNADFIFAFDLSNGMIDPNFTPVLDKGPVDSVAAGPNNTVYMGGAFTSVDGSSAPGVAQLTVDPGGSDDGQLVPGFAARTDGEVTTLAYHGNAVYLGGHFGRVDGKVANVARVNATTGAFDSSFQFTISSPPSGRSPKVKVLALSPDGSTLAIAGTFNMVNGQSISRLALINTGGGLGFTATLDNWAAPIMATTCQKQKSFVNGIDFSPDGSYLVEVNTGFKTTGGPAVCDSAARFPAGVTGTNIQPTWQNYTGGDTLDSVAIVGTVVYIAGHQRWSNDECGTNRVCEPNAVLQNGLSALDANTGLSLPFWHPQTSRGIGIPALTAFPAGAFPGSDGGLLIGTSADSVAGATHDELAMLPETTATAPTPGGPIPSGIWADGRPGVDEESGPNTGVAAECVDDAGNSGSPGSAVELITCTNDNEQNWTVNPGGTIGVNGLCLDTQGGGTAAGTPVVVDTCGGAPTEVWQQGTGNTLVNQGASGLCLTDPGSSTTSGTGLQIVTCTGSSGQVWPLPVAPAPPPPPPAGPFYSQLVNGDNVPCLKYSAATVVLTKCTGAPPQTWTAESNGTFQINGKCLDTVGEGTSPGTLTGLATCNGSSTQAWTVEPDYTVRNQASGLCLDVPGGIATFGLQLDIATCVPGVNYQKWRVPTY